MATPAPAPPAPPSAAAPLTDWVALHGDAFKGRKALVTGGAGFIGSHLAEALFRLGAAVVVLDDLTGGAVDNLKHLPAVHFVRGSILDSNLLARCVAGCDVVFHQAALGSVPASVNHPRRYHEVNAGGTLNVLEAARLAGVRRVMFAASSSAYGDSEALPKVETMPVWAKSPYAATKAAGEAMLRAWSDSYGLDTVSLRYFNIFGPRQNANSAYAAVIAAFAKALLAGTAPVIYGDGEQSRDFTYVDNAVHANLLAARAPGRLGGVVLNVACGARVTVNELAAEMARRLGRPDLAASHQPDRAGDVKHSQADLSAARAALGYEPVVNFQAGLAATVDWYRSAGA
ncbi:MAG: biosynthesis protein WbpP [Phycisphaerales bacterium]|nr:biosynthesis protein WbpP [Phycisphaerales bacterium]